MLLALIILLTAVLVGLVTMNAFSTRSYLSAPALVYVADISKLGIDFTTFAPISIVATLISIVIGLWWDQLDMTLRLLQPYIAMSKQPTPIRKGAGLTYRSKTWAGAAFKAARNRHWLLFVTNMGSVLCQIRNVPNFYTTHVAGANGLVTVSMSALFEKKSKQCHPLDYTRNKPRNKTNTNQRKSYIRHFKRS